MAKTIQITKVKIDRIIIDPQDQTVVVEFDIADDNGDYRRRIAATFYRTTPSGVDGTPRALGSNEFVLPASYGNGLVQLYQKVVDVLQTTYLV